MASAGDFHREARELARALYVEARDLLAISAEIAARGAHGSLEIAGRLKEDLDRRIRSYLSLLWRCALRIGLLGGVLILALLVSIWSGWDRAWVLVLPTGLLLALLLGLAYPVLAALGALDLLLSRYPTFKREVVEWPLRLIATVAWSSVVLTAFLYAFPPSRFSALGPLAVLAVFATALGGYLGWGGPSPRLRRRLALFPITLLIVSFVAMQFPLSARAIRSLRSGFDSQLAKRMSSIPAPIQIRSADDLIFADPQTGEPSIWYEGDSTTGYTLYDSPGFGRFGDALDAADTPEEHAAILSWHRADAEQRRRDEASAQARREGEEKERSAQAAAEAHRRELDAVRQLAGSINIDSTPRLVLALAPARNDVPIDAQAARQTAATLATTPRDYSLSDHLSSDRFTSSSYFARLRQGDLGLLREAEVLSHRDYVLSGLVQADCEVRSRFEGVISCAIELQAELIGPGGSARTATTTAVGAGFNEPNALENASRALVSQHSDALLPVTLQSQ